MRGNLLLLFLIYFFVINSKAAIYGTDDRQDVKDVPSLVEVSSAIAVSVPSIFLEENNDESFNLFEPESLLDLGLCKDEKFIEQKTMGNCTGFLVGPKTLVTAGHCTANIGINNMAQEYCNAFSWVFDYNLNLANDYDYNKIPKNKLYKCVKAIHAVNIENFPFSSSNIGNLADFAILELDREVEGVKPLVVSEIPLGVGDRVFTIGHPWGMPAKYSGLANVIATSFTQIFSTALDTQSGNSGGPVFNEKNEVVGILTAGHQTDYYPTVNGCLAANRCDEAGESCIIDSELFKLNEVQLIKEVIPYINL